MNTFTILAQDNRNGQILISGPSYMDILNALIATVKTEQDALNLLCRLGTVKA